MATSKISATEGAGKNVATHAFTEDALTKELQRIALSTSGGTDATFGAGAASAGTPRVVLASDDPGVVLLQSIAGGFSRTFFTTRTTNGNDVIDWPGGPGLLSVFGVWGTATLQFAYSPNAGTTYINIDGALFDTNNGNFTMEFKFPAGKIRTTLASASGTTNLTAMLQSTR